MSASIPACRAVRRSATGFVLCLVACLLFASTRTDAVQLATLEEVRLNTLLLPPCGFFSSCWQAQQGVAWGNGKFFTTRGNCGVGGYLIPSRMYRFSGTWDAETDLVPSYAGALCHLGDIEVKGDQVWVPLSDFVPGSGANNFHLATFDADLGYLNHWDVTQTFRTCTSTTGPGDLNDLAGVGFHNNEVYAVEYKTTANAHLLKFQTGAEATCAAAWPIPTTNANGVSFWHNAILITHGTGTFTGELDVYDLTSLTECDVNQPYATHTYDISLSIFDPQIALIWNHPEGLTITGDGDLWVCTSGGARVRRIQMPPVAAACKIGGPYAGRAEQPIQFSATNSYDPDGSIQQYEWDFGDASTAAGASPAHTYAAPGTYTVTLRVQDNDGHWSCCKTTATVQRPVAVALSEFEAAGIPGGIHLSWRLEYDRAPLGIDVLRAREPRGPYSRRNVEPLAPPAREFIDETDEPGYYRLEVLEADGTVQRLGLVFANPGAASGVFGGARFSPNPFRESTVVHFDAPATAHVTADVFDSRGRFVARVYDGTGGGRVVWNGSDSQDRRVVAGVYYCRVSVDGRISHSKVVVSPNE